MYKVYINETPLFFRQIDQLNAITPSNSTELRVKYSGRPRSLLNAIDLMEKTSRYESVSIYHGDINKLRSDFESLYKLIEAAGGVVFNTKKEILTMFRRGSWDLPKGKIDEGETTEIAAIREVKEETGLQNVDLGKFLTTTYHTYKNGKGKRVLKKTYWYLMQTTDHDIQPQIEEDIELVEWMLPIEFLTKKPLYNTIREVVAHLKV